jgi:hypothetical protein
MSAVLLCSTATILDHQYQWKCWTLYPSTNGPTSDQRMNWFRAEEVQIVTQYRESCVQVHLCKLRAGKQLKLVIWKVTNETSEYTVRNDYVKYPHVHYFAVSNVCSAILCVSFRIVGDGLWMCLLRLDNKFQDSSWTMHRCGALLIEYATAWALVRGCAPYFV